MAPHLKSLPAHHQHRSPRISNASPTKADRTIFLLAVWCKFHFQSLTNQRSSVGRKPQNWLGLQNWKRTRASSSLIKGDDVCMIAFREKSQCNAHRALRSRSIIYQSFLGRGCCYWEDSLPSWNFVLKRPFRERENIIASYSQCLQVSSLPWFPHAWLVHPPPSPAPASQTRRLSTRRKPDDTKRSVSFLFTPKETLLYPTPDLRTSRLTLCSSQMSPIALQPKSHRHSAQEHFQYLPWISFSCA